MYSKEKHQDILDNLHTIRDYIRWTISEMSTEKSILWTWLGLYMG